VRTAASTAATPRHGEDIHFKPACEPCLNDLPQISGHEGDHADAVGRDHCLQWPGNRAADERPDVEPGEVQRLAGGHVVSQLFPGLSDDPSRFGLYDVNLPGHVENRRDPVVPRCECRLHRSTFLQIISITSRIDIACKGT
jgi:hypothetical protein